MAFSLFVPNNFICKLNSEFSLQKVVLWSKDGSVVLNTFESGSATEPAGQNNSQSVLATFEDKGAAHCLVVTILKSPFLFCVTIWNLKIICICLSRFPKQKAPDNQLKARLQQKQQRSYTCRAQKRKIAGRHSPVIQL